MCSDATVYSSPDWRGMAQTSPREDLEEPTRARLRPGPNADLPLNMGIGSSVELSAYLAKPTKANPPPARRNLTSGFRTRRNAGQSTLEADERASRRE